jgi:NAD(P)-dependent dehydrogenase (short-subunit alcohol dehydrogenase family)
MDLKDKVVVITGGNRGLGKSLAKVFVRVGAKVIITSLNKKDLEKAAEEIGAYFFVMDVTRSKQVAKVTQTIVEQFGRIDIWINNAGIWTAHQAIEEIDWGKDVHHIFEVNFFGTVHGSREALLQMRKQHQGTIVNVISTSGLAGRYHSSGYGASKFAASGFTKSLRLEAEPDGINVIGIYPGGMKTAIFGKNVPSDYNEYMEPDEVAQKVVDNLLSDNPESEQIIRR